MGQVNKVESNVPDEPSGMQEVQRVQRQDHERPVKHAEEGLILVDRSAPALGEFDAGDDGSDRRGKRGDRMVSHPPTPPPSRLLVREGDSRSEHRSHKDEDV